MPLGYFGEQVTICGNWQSQRTSEPAFTLSARDEVHERVVEAPQERKVELYEKLYYMLWDSHCAIQALCESAGHRHLFHEINYEVGSKRQKN